MIFSTEALVKYEKNANVTQLEIPLYGHQAKKKMFCRNTFSFKLSLFHIDR